MKRKFANLAWASFAAITLGLSAPAFADLNAEDINRFVRNNDANKDGMVSKVEVMNRAASMFDKMDSGKKGMLDEKKAMAFLLELQNTDGNRNVMITRADYMKKVEAAFDKTDAARKGMLDIKQAEAFLKELMKSGS
jgi:hypothetical protein